MPGAGRTRSPVGNGKKPTSIVTTGWPKRSGTPCAIALRLTPRSPRGTGLDSPRREWIISIRLIPASGDQDHTA